MLHQNRHCAYAQPAAPKPVCIGTKPAFSFWINISTVSEVRCDCQGLGLVALIEASILVFDTMQVFYWPVLGQIRFCSFDRRCKTCLDTKPVLHQGRFCSLTTLRASLHPLKLHTAGCADKQGLPSSISVMRMILYHVYTCLLALVVLDMGYVKLFRGNDCVHPIFDDGLVNIN